MTYCLPARRSERVGRVEGKKEVTRYILQPGPFFCGCSRPMGVHFGPRFSLFLFTTKGIKSNCLSPQSLPPLFLLPLKWR